MKTACYGLAWLLVAAFAFSMAALVDTLPVTNDGYAATVHDSWSGVLQIWCHGGWKPGNGSFTPWLNKAASRFERKHPGVRVQVTGVDEADLRDFAAEESPPDVILFAPGMIKRENLALLDCPDALREGLKSVGQSDGGCYALPVAMGAYAWAINTNLISSVPYDWSALDDLSSLKSQKRYLIDIPADGKYNCWSGAFGALMSPRRVYIEGDAAVGGEVDIGLYAASPSPTVEPESEIVICKAPKTLAEDFGTRDSVYSLFTSGKVAAIPATQFEIRNLARLTQSGKGVSWKAEAGGGAFSDQLLLAAAADIERKDHTARMELSKELIAFMLSEDMQKELSSIRALSVTNCGELYAGQYGMAELEKIASGVISLPNAFDDSFREAARREVERLINPE